MEHLKTSFYPAGYESDNSDEDWYSERAPNKNHFDVQSVDYAVADPEDTFSLLKKAINEGKVGAIEQLLDNGIDVDCKLIFDWTPLMYAVSVADDKMAKVFLDRGANANFSKDGRTVLMAACGASADEDKIARCVDLLLSRNADLNMANRCQMTCLMMAASKDYCKILNLLASYGADLNMQDANGYTALSFAVHHGHEKAVLKLLQLGADSSITTSAGKTPAQLASLLNHTQISRILSSNINPVLPINSAEESLCTSIYTNPQPQSSVESVPKLNDLELFLHGLDLGYLADIMHEKDIAWGELLTMEQEDLAKVGITDLKDQKKVLSALRQMHLDEVELKTIEELGVNDNGSEELLNFLLKLKQQCCFLTEIVQDTIRHFPLQVSKLVFTLDHKREAEAVCSQLMVQIQDLQTEVNCLHNLLCQMNEAPNYCRPPPPVAHGNRKLPPLARVAVGTLGAALVLFFSCRYLRK